MTKNFIKISLIVICCLVFAGCSNAATTKRIYLSGQGRFDAFEWDFKCSGGQNSGKWATIKVPSCWEQQGFGNYDYGDVDNKQKSSEKGFYRKEFNLDSINKQQVKIIFQGVMTDAIVKINGKSAGPTHQGAFTAFSYDITDLVKQGSNLLEVEVAKMSANDHINASQRKADYWVFGGIFRPVYLEIVPEQLIDRLAIDARMDGEFKMQVYTKHASVTNKIQAQIETLDGEKIGDLMKAYVLDQGDAITVTQNLNNIKLWSDEIPNLYRVKVSLLDKDKVIHTVSQRFGFRTFEHRNGHGFFLNGKRILLKGVNRHCFRPESGRTLSPQDSIEDVKLLKSMNMNTVRCSHYSPDKHFLDTCDELGLLVLHELCAWHKPLHESVGRKIVEEIVTRDQCHPCVIMWNNGNHSGFNPKLEAEFYKWDIQDRRVLRNESQKYNKLPMPADPKLEPIDTRFYPTYEKLERRVKGKYTVLPNECLHALYDGGGGAGLEDFWALLKDSPVGGGLIFWAFADEGIMRTDQNNKIDVAGNKAPDGLVGPHLEKEASFYTVREIWSPIQIAMEILPENFTGDIEVENTFTSINLAQCKFQWQLVDFAEPDDREPGYTVQSSGSVKGPSIEPRDKGILKLKLPPNWKKHDALMLDGIDHQNNKVWTWSWPIINRKDIYSKALNNKTGEVVVDEDNPFVVYSNDLTLTFDSKTALLKEVKIKDKILGFSNGPKLYAQPLIVRPTFNPEISYRKEASSYIIEGRNLQEFELVRWTIRPNGIVKLDYEYSLPKGKYDYYGAGFDLPEDKVISKKWLGEGPYRVWKNRIKGTIFGLWENQYNDSLPGERFIYPEFKGCFADVHWMKIATKDGDVTLYNANERTFIGILRPSQGIDPKGSAWFYPKQGGLYFFDAISPIGTKTKKPHEIGPAGEKNKAGGTIIKTVYLSFSK